MLTLSLLLPCCSPQGRRLTSPSLCFPICETGLYPVQGDPDVWMPCLLFYMFCNECAINKPLVMDVHVSLLPDLAAALDSASQGESGGQRKRKAKGLVHTNCADR